MSELNPPQSSEGTQPPPGKKPGVLSLTIRDKAVLYAAYMPFVKNGGLFIPTHKFYEIGDEVFLLLNLMEEKEKLPAAGKVIWVTPKGAQSNRAAGIGVQFSAEEGPEIRDKIETYLAGALQADRLATQDVSHRFGSRIDFSPLLFLALHFTGTRFNFIHQEFFTLKEKFVVIAFSNSLD